MIEEFTKAWFANLHSMRENFAAKHPDDYKEVVRAVVQMLDLESSPGRRPAGSRRLS